MLTDLLFLGCTNNVSFRLNQQINLYLPLDSVTLLSPKKQAVTTSIGVLEVELCEITNTYCRCYLLQIFRRVLLV